MTTQTLYTPAAWTPDLLGDLAHYDNEAKYLMHRIIWGRALRTEDQRGFVHLKWDYLREFIPDRVLKPLVDSLIAKGVIERDNWFIRGKKAYGYRLVPPYNTDFLRSSVDGQVGATMKKHAAKDRRSLNLPVHRWLASHFDRLTIDGDKARGLVNSDLFPLIDAIETKTWSLSTCRYGRVHTNITSLPRCLRSCLRLDGQHLVSADVVNSQPLFLSLLVSLFLFNKNSLSLSFSSPSTLSSITTRILEAESIESLVNQGQSEHQSSDKTTIEYQRLCEQGELYESLLASLRNEDEGCLYGRRQTKTELFRDVLYGKNKARGTVRTVFNEQFPQVAEVIKDLKRKDHRHLSHLMQRLESKLVIERTCGQLMEEHPDQPLLTIHDSILTTPDHADKVIEVLRSQFLLVKLNCKLKVEALDEPEHQERSEAV